MKPAPRHPRDPQPDDIEIPAVPRHARRADDDDVIGGDRGGRRPPGRGGRGGGDDAEGEDDQGEAYQEEPVDFKDLPKAAREAVAQHCPGAGHFDAVRLTDGDVVAYNVLARRGRVGMSVTVSAAGELMEHEVDVSPSRLPKSVRETLTRDYDGIDFDRLGSVAMHFFEMQYEDADGVRRVVQIDAAGKVLADFEDEYDDSAEGGNDGDEDDEDGETRN